MRSRRFEVLRCLHFFSTTRGHRTMTWVVSFSSLRPFGSRRSAQVIKHRLWPDILAAAAKQRAADEEQARKDELKRLKEEQARQAELERRKRLQLDSKAGKRREFGRVMWKVTSQEIQRRTKRAFLRICSNLYTPGEDGLRGTRAAWLRLRKQREYPLTYPPRAYINSNRSAERPS